MTYPTHNPPLRFQAHRQNALSQRYNQILPKSLPARPAQAHERQDYAIYYNRKHIQKQEPPVPNNIYKILGAKWLLQGFCHASAFVTADSDEPASPNISYMRPLAASGVL